MMSVPRLALTASVALLAGCGSAAAATGAATVPSPTVAAVLARGAFGQLVQLSGTTLTLSTTTGDVTVTYGSTTTITNTSTGSSGDIVPGSCVVVVGQKDATGAVTASSVRLSQAVNGACAAGFRPGAGPGPGFSPPAVPNGTPRPTLNPNTAFASGMVTAVNGTAVTVKAASGALTTVSVPTTLQLTESSPGTAADLTVDICVRAVGPRNSGGVVKATALTLQPTNASGTCTQSRGGFGGGGFGGFPPGGAGAPTAAA